MAKKFCKANIKIFRLWLGACVGSVGAIAVSLAPMGFWSAFGKVLLFLAIVLVAFASKNIKKTLELALAFACFTFLAGGVVVGVFYLLQTNFASGSSLSYLSQAPLGVVGLGFLCFLAFVKSILQEVNKLKKIKAFGCKVSLTAMGKTFELQGIFDSGNSLTDGGVPVCFLCECYASSVLKEEISKQICLGRPPKNMHYVDFVTVDGRAKTVVFEAEKFCVDGKEKKSFIAFGNAGGNGFDVLVNLFLTEGYL